MSVARLSSSFARPARRRAVQNLVVHRIDSHRHLHARVRGLELDSKPGVAAHSATGARLAPRAIAVVERADAEFFADVPTAEALSLLRRLAGSFDARATATGSARSRASRKRAV
jgi:hypothetical protein